MSDNTISKDGVVIERTFDAPANVVWQMWTRPEYFKKWYGPKGFSVPVAEMDVRVGGKHLFCMATPDGSRKMWSTGEYSEVIPNQRLVYTDSMADEHGNVVAPPPEMGAYPTTTEVTVRLEEIDGRTKMVVTHAGIPASDGASGGWEQAFDKMADQIETVLKSQ
jgi:uncharacterized protein YndB with AHSA1/START domain